MEELKKLGKLKAKDIMTKDLLTLSLDDDIEFAENIMELAHIRHLPVVDGERLVGLVTHRDLLRASISIFADIDIAEEIEIKTSIPVKEIMQTKITVIKPETSLIEAAELMEKNKFGCLPVVENDSLVGIITEADFVIFLGELLRRLSELE